MSADFAVSLIIASRNVEQFIAFTLESAQSQTVKAIEILVIDDGSTDRTRDIVTARAASDSRIRLLDGPRAGPGAARNVGLAAARGEWVAVLDGDDLMHPQRLQSLLELGQSQNADIVADELIAFSESETSRKAWLFIGDAIDAPDGLIGLIDLFRPPRKAIAESRLGYLKPMIRNAFLGSSGLRYQEDISIGEDFDFLARLLAHGARMAYTAEPFYLYRRHAGSISYRLSAANAERMVEASARFQAEQIAEAAAELRHYMALRHARLRTYADAQHVIAAIKERNPMACLRFSQRNPRAAWLALGMLGEGITRRFTNLAARIAAREPSAPGILRVEVPSNNAEDIAAAACNLVSGSLGAARIDITGPMQSKLNGYIYRTATSQKVNKHG